MMNAIRWSLLVVVLVLVVAALGLSRAARAAGPSPAPPSPVVAAFPAETRAADEYVYVEEIYLVHANGTIKRVDAP